MLLRVSKVLTFGDVMKVTGVTRSELLHFLRVGVVTSSVKGTVGPGDAREFNADDVFRVMLAVELKRRWHMESDKLRPLIDKVMAQGRRSVVVVWEPEGFGTADLKLGASGEGSAYAEVWAGDHLGQLHESETGSPSGVVLQLGALITKTESAIHAL